MSLPELAILYLLVGIGSVVSLLMIRRPLTATTLLDAALLGTLWPLYGPFFIIQNRQCRVANAAMPSGVDGGYQAVESEGLHLGDLLPDRHTAEVLELRLSLAGSRVDEIDRLLAQPELSEDHVRQRISRLTESGDDRAAATVRQRLQSIKRLQELRGCFAAELTELKEIISQFRIQAEVARLAGEDDGRSARELLNELHLRLEILDEIHGHSLGHLGQRPDRACEAMHCDDQK